MDARLDQVCHTVQFDETLLDHEGERFQFDYATGFFFLQLFEVKFVAVRLQKTDRLVLFLLLIEVYPIVLVLIVGKDRNVVLARFIYHGIVLFEG